MIYDTADATTAQRALNMLSELPGHAIDGEQVTTRARIAPAGTVSDGTRVIYYSVCKRGRYLSATNGAGEHLFDFDQRDYWDEPGLLANAAISALSSITR